MAADTVPIMPDVPAPEKDKPEEEMSMCSSSVIARDTVIDGDVSCSSDLTILGHVKGNITANGHIYLCGLVEGQVTCDSMAMSSCTLKGGITATSGVVQDADSTLVGDVISANLTAAGKIVGNVRVEDCINLKSTAVIMGDLSFRNLSVEQGAALQGEIQTTREDVPEISANMEIPE